MNNNDCIKIAMDIGNSDYCAVNNNYSSDTNYSENDIRRPCNMPQKYFEQFPHSQSTPGNHFPYSPPTQCPRYPEPIPSYSQMSYHQSIGHTFYQRVVPYSPHQMAMHASNTAWSTPNTWINYQPNQSNLIEWRPAPENPPVAAVCVSKENVTAVNIKRQDDIGGDDAFLSDFKSCTSNDSKIQKDVLMDRPSCTFNSVAPKEASPKCDMQSTQVIEGIFFRRTLFPKDFSVPLKLIGFRGVLEGRVNATGAEELSFWNAVTIKGMTKICLICNITFKLTFDKLYRHWQAAHSKGVKCPFCNAQFTTYAELAAHLNLNHKKQLDLLEEFSLTPNCVKEKGQHYICKLCGEKGARSRIKDHCRIIHHKNVEICNTCDVYFANSKSLSRHQQDCQKKPAVVKVMAEGKDDSIQEETALALNQSTFLKKGPITRSSKRRCTTSINKRPELTSAVTILSKQKNKDEFDPNFINDYDENLPQPAIDEGTSHNCGEKHRMASFSRTSNCNETVMTSMEFDDASTLSSLANIGEHEADFEVCVHLFQSVRDAVKVGAKRLVICSAYELTPSISFLNLAKEHFPFIMFIVMIRPRLGDFVYSDDEIEIMKRDIQNYKKFGADGFVFGVATEAGLLDCHANSSLVNSAYPLPCSFHHVAFSKLLNPLESIKQLRGIGFSRIQVLNETSPEVKRSVILESEKNTIETVIVGQIDDFTFDHPSFETSVKIVQFLT